MIRFQLSWLLLIFTHTLVAQINFTAKDVVPPYDGYFRYGSNLGNYPPWSNAQVGNIAAGNTALSLEGIGVQSFRSALPEHFLETWGYDIRTNDFEHWEDLGMNDHLAFLGFPSQLHQDPTTFCDTFPSALFANMYEPIWDGGANGTPVNENNYYALYVYKTVNEYGNYVRFWEIWNEPDFTASPNSWLPPSDPNSWWVSNPDPCDYPLRAPIFHYVRLLRISYEVIKSITPDAYVCIGGIGRPSFLDAVMRNTDNPSNGSATGNYPNKGGAYFDVLSFHSYPHIDGSMWEFPPGGGLVYHRHSDRGVEGMLKRQTDLKNVLTTYGYDGNTHPEKLWFLSETMVPRKEFNNYIGSPEAQRNYLTKAMVEAQKNGIVQVDVFSISELTIEADAWNEYLLMGLFTNLSSTLPYTQELTSAGVTYKTITTFLANREYDPVKTAQLNLPLGIKGAAFKDVVGNHRYILWAVTSQDQSEQASAIYSFPVSFGLDEVAIREWDFSANNNVFIFSSTNVPLTGAPIFVEAAEGNPPVANFTASASGDCAPVNVTFSDNSIDAETWDWSFPGGNPATSTAQNPIVTYEVAGTYDVLLTVSNDIGAHSIVQSGVVTVEDVPIPDFDIEVDGLTVHFTNTTVNGIFYEWQFGDSNTSIEENPSHTFAANNTYLITLKAINDCGFETIFQNVTIMVNSVENILEISQLEVFPNPNDGQFTIHFEAKAAESLTIEFCDLFGKCRKVKQVPFQSGKLIEKIDLQDVPGGVYFLKMSNDEGAIWKKIVKQ